MLAAKLSGLLSPARTGWTTTPFPSRAVTPRPPTRGSPRRPSLLLGCGYGQSSRGSGFKDPKSSPAPWPTDHKAFSPLTDLLPTLPGHGMLAIQDTPPLLIATHTPTPRMGNSVRSLRILTHGDTARDSMRPSSLAPLVPTSPSKEGQALLRQPLMQEEETEPVAPLRVEP